MIETKPAPKADRDVARILAGVKRPGSRRSRPALVVLVGLPASGKSRVAEELRAQTGAVVLESDALRRLLFARRTYSALESRRLFVAIHAAAEELLADGVSVILDATNVSEAEREPLYEMAERHGVKLVLVQVTAPPSVLRRRLTRRAADGASRSEASVRVYERMRPRAEEIGRPHHVIDTSRNVKPALGVILKEIDEL